MHLVDGREIEIDSSKAVDGEMTSPPARNEVYHPHERAGADLSFCLEEEASVHYL